MRKFPKDYSVTGVVLVFVTLYAGILLRLLNLESISSWGDEVASLYYAQHLDRAFLYDSHTPFYYSLCRLWISIFPKTIVSLRVLFITLSFLLSCLTGYLLYKKRGPGIALVFFILWWLWPTEIIYSRQARHYALYAEFTFLILVLWDYRGTFSRKWLWPVWAVFQLIHPFTIIPVWFMCGLDFLRKKMGLKETLFYLSTTFPIATYFLVRLIFFGKTKVLSNISWLSINTNTFIKSLLLLFAGDSVPLTSVYPLSFWTSVIFIIVIVLIFLVRSEFFLHLKQDKKGISFLILLGMTLVFVELFSYLVTNVRMNRCFIFLIPFFLYALLDRINEFEVRRNQIISVALCVVLVGYSTLIFKPWRSYLWDDDSVKSFKSYLAILPEKELVVCANPFQLDYYFNRPYKDCIKEALRLHLKKQDFYLFDISGGDKILAMFVVNDAKVDQFKMFDRSLFYSVSY